METLAKMDKKRHMPKMCVPKIHELFIFCVYTLEKQAHQKSNALALVAVGDLPKRLCSSTATTLVNAAEICYHFSYVWLCSAGFSYCSLL